MVGMIAAAMFSISVEIEEPICRYEPPNNGAGPLWCYGAPLVVRMGNDVFVSIIKTGKDVPPLCNTKWQIWKRSEEGWKVVQQEEDYREREPCPLMGFDGKLFLSVNPSLAPRGTRYGPCDPHLLEFSLDDLSSPPKPIRPIWAEGATFTDHSYRGAAIEGKSGEILLLNIDAKDGDQFWAFRDSSGNWVNAGRIHFPIRACYPQVALKNRSAHVLAIGDIVEPNEEWRRYKREKTGREWDYVFRRLFYAWSPDISKEGFSEPIEIEDVDATGGYIRNQDMWVDEEGDAHLLYLKQTTVPIIRDRFLPGTPVVVSLEYVLIRRGRVVERRSLIKGGEGIEGEWPTYGRLHATDDGRLLLIYSAGGQNKIMQIKPDITPPQVIPLKDPFTTFFTNTERGGSNPSRIIDIFGVGRDSRLLRYAKVIVEERK